MKKEELISAFDDPARLLSFDTEELASLVERNPCSGMLRMLLVKSLKEGDDIRFEHEMRAAAAHLPVRGKLYEWLKRGPIPDPPAEKRAGESQHVPTPVDPAEKEEPSTHSEGRESPMSKDRGMNELERQYLTEAVHVSIGMEVEAEMEDVVEADDVEKSTARPPSPSATRPSTGVEEKEQVDIHSFLDFISAPAGGQPPLDQTASLTGLGAEKDKNNELIARFISNEKREKAEFFDPERMAKASLVDNEELVTETLARVYQHQGNLEKALRAYESLQLKFPEKRLYFAGRIERIKELIKKRKHS